MYNLNELKNILYQM